ncbi:MAG: gliding motility-associated C-terminal domain-containing protein [bacterium]|nr:gliding motility-associated C-terminal domain-containing protein [bacterium]
MKTSQLLVTAVLVLLGWGKNGLRAQTGCYFDAEVIGCACDPHEWWSPSATLTATYPGSGGGGILADTSYLWTGPNGYVAPGQQVIVPFPGTYTVTVVVTNVTDTICITSDVVTVPVCPAADCQGDDILQVGEVISSPTITYSTGGQLQNLTVGLEPCIVQGDTIVVETTPYCIPDGITGRLDNNPPVAPYTFVGEGGWCGFVCDCNSSPNGATTEDQCIQPYATILMEGGTAKPLTVCASGSVTAKYLFPVVGNPETFTVMVKLSTDESTIVNFNVRVRQGNGTLKAVIPPVDPPCEGTMDTVFASASGGVTPYMYTWNNNGGVDSSIIVTPGSYTVTVTDAGGCTATATTMIDSIALGVTVEAFPMCDASGSVVAGGYGDPLTPFSYEWSTGDTTAAVDHLAGGTYTVTVTNVAGCTVTKAVDLIVSDSLLATITTTEVSCYANNDGTATVAITGGVAPFSILWSTENTSSTIADLSADSYAVTVTDVNGCTATATATINQPDSLSVMIAWLEPTCYGENDGTIIAGPDGGSQPWTYQWSTGETTQAVTGLAKWYVVTVADINGCSVTDSVLITQPPLLEVALQKTEPLCFGESNGQVAVAVSGGSPGYSYFWSTGWDSSQLVAIPSAPYAVTVTDANGCEKSTSVFLEQPDSLQFTSQIWDASCSGTADGEAGVQVFGGITPYEYLWSNGKTSREIDELLADGYFITVTDANGCEVVGNIEVGFKNPDQVYIPNAFSPNGDGINDAFLPFSGECVKKIQSFLVFDRWGEKVYENYNFQPNQPDQGWQGEMKNKVMQPGIYAWFAQVEFYSGEVKFFKGGVQLMK